MSKDEDRRTVTPDEYAAAAQTRMVRITEKSPAARENQHTHKFVIPVEFEHTPFSTRDGYGEYRSDPSKSTQYTKVTKLRCECGEETKRDE